MCDLRRSIILVLKHNIPVVPARGRAEVALGIYKTFLIYRTCMRRVPAKPTNYFLPSTSLFYKAAQTTSQYYFVLQSLPKLLPSTTVYYKACKKYFPVLLCSTKLAKSISQYYFVIRSLHKENFYTQQVLSQRSFYTQQAF